MKNTVHCNKLSSSLYVTIKNISRIRPNLDIDTKWTLIQGLILSRLDYCNGTLAAISGIHMEKIAENTEHVMLYHTAFVKVQSYFEATERPTLAKGSTMN